MKIASVNTVHSANSYQSKPLLRGITQTNLHGQNIAGTSLRSSNSNPIDGLSYLAMILSHVFSKINVSFNTVTKRLRENKKKYDELSALVKPVEVVVDKMANLAIDHAGDPKFADPTTALQKYNIKTVVLNKYVSHNTQSNLPTQPVFTSQMKDKVRVILASIIWLSSKIPSSFYSTVVKKAEEYKRLLNLFMEAVAESPGVYVNPRCNNNDPIAHSIIPTNDPRYLLPDYKLRYYMTADKNSLITGDLIKGILDMGVQRGNDSGYYKGVEAKYIITCATAQYLNNDTGSHYTKDNFEKPVRGIYKIINQLELIKNQVNFNPTLDVRAQVRNVEYESYNTNCPENAVNACQYTPIRILFDDELQKIIDLVEYLQPSSTLTEGKLRDVSTALKLSELRSIVNDGRKKMFSLNALKDTDTAELKAQVSNIQVVSELVSGLISNFKTVVSSFAQHMS